MPNLILTKSCNLNCEYCFAGVNKTRKVQELSLTLYLYYLRHLKINGNNYIRLIGGEPLLHSRINEFLSLGLKGGFHILVFTNLALPPEKISKIFSLGDIDYGNIRVNINVNKRSFYSEKEILNIEKNIQFLNSKGVNILASYLVYEKGQEEYIFYLADKYNIRNIHLKPYNSNGVDDIATSRPEYGKLFLEIIKKYGKNHQLHISCGFSSTILSQSEIEECQKVYNIHFKFGCKANGGKYDIDFDGKIFRCFALENYYKGMYLQDYYMEYEGKIIEEMNDKINTKNNIHNCLGYSYKYN